MHHISDICYKKSNARDHRSLSTMQSIIECANSLKLIPVPLDRTKTQHGTVAPSRHPGNNQSKYQKYNLIQISSLDEQGGQHHLDMDETHPRQQHRGGPLRTCV